MNFSPEDYLFSRKIQIRFSDIDAFRHVNNVAFLDYAESIRVEYLQKYSGLDPDSSTFSWILVRSEIDYKEQVFLQDELWGGIKCSKIGNTSFTIDVDFWKKKDTKIVPVAFSQFVVCCYNFKKQSLVSIPDSFKTFLLPEK